MRLYLLNFLLFIVAAAQESTNEVRIEELYAFDDDRNLVTVSLERAAFLFPLELRSNDVKFYLHTRDSLVENELFVDDVETLKKSLFDANRETKFVTHGWINSKSSDACLLVKNAFLKQGDFNVIVIDWSQKSLELYLRAAEYVPEIAKRVAKMIDFLQNNGMNLNTTTLVGHSLGAHIAGLAGYYSKGLVNYVVGLDPARPDFLLKKPGERISTEDAKYVEVIHSNGGKLGLLEPIGKVDFYPNGGKRQPGCIIDIGGSCSHARSYELFAESLVSKTGFYGKLCTISGEISPKVCNGKLGIMGGLERRLRYYGSYYVPTKDRAPFAIGKVLS